MGVQSDLDIQRVHLCPLGVCDVAGGKNLKACGCFGEVLTPPVGLGLYKGHHTKQAKRLPGGGGGKQGNKWKEDSG